MKNLKEIKKNNDITIIEEKFEKMVLAGVGCSCRVYVTEMKQHVVAEHFIEVIHP